MTQSKLTPSKTAFAPQNLNKYLKQETCFAYLYIFFYTFAQNFKVYVSVVGILYV